MSRLVNDLVTRLYLNSDWRDVSSDVRYSSGIEINRGRRSEDGSTPPQTCSLTLKNTSGAYTERDPMGVWYGYLGRNTPLEVGLRLAKDTATATASNGWGSTDADAAGAWSVLPWTVLGTTSNYAKAAGKATHALAAAGDVRVSYLATLAQRDVDVVLTVNVPTSNVTGSSLGAGIAPANILLHGQGALTDYYMLRLVAQTDETYVMDWWAATASGTPASITGGAAVAVPSLTQSSQDIRVRVQVEGRTLRAKAWSASSGEPYGWHKTATIEDSVAAATVVRDAAGWIGVRSSLVGGNTNGPITISYDNIEVRTPLYFGEVSEWPQTRDVSGTDKTVEIEASGITRRLNQRESPALSAPRRAIPDDPECTYYWPLEDGPLATLGVPAVGTPSLLHLSLGVGSATAFGSGELAPWLPDGVTVQNEVLGVEQYTLSQPSFTAANGWRVEYYRQARNVDDAGDSFYVSDNADGLWLVTINHGTGDVSIVSPYSTVTTTYPALTSGDGAWIKFVVFGSGTVFWRLYMNDTLVLSSSAAGTAQSVRQIVFTGGERGLAIGQIAVYHGNTVSGLPSPYLGHAGEVALTRALRLCSENSISLSYLGAAADTAAMGPQGVFTLLDLIQECADTDGGILYEPRGLLGLTYRTLRSMYSQTSWATLSFANKEISPPWKPVPDDLYLRNKITVQQRYGGSYVYELASGRLSTLPPESGGVGIYDDSDNLNVYAASQLPDQAAWRVHLGTVDEERYPRVKVELHREQIHTTNPTLYARLLNLDVGDQITLADMDATGIYDNSDQIALGYRRFLNRFNHTLEITCAPASPFRIATLDSASAVLDGDGLVAEDLTTTETDVDSTFAASVLWSTTDEPYDVKVSGEVMTVTTAVGASSPQTLTVTRSANGVVKSHLAGVSVSVARPVYLGL